MFQHTNFYHARARPGRHYRFPLSLLPAFLLFQLYACKTQNLFQQPPSENNRPDSVFLENRDCYQYRIRQDDKISISIWNNDDISVGSVYGIYNSAEGYGKWLLVDANGEIALPQERYNECPFRITARPTDSRGYDSTYKMTVSSDSLVTITSPGKSKYKGRLGQIISTPFLDLLIRKNDSLLSQKPTLLINDRYELIVNAISDAYIRDYIEEKFTAADTTVNFLNKEVDTYSQKLASSEKSIENYKEQKGVVNIKQETETNVRSLSELKTRLAGLQMDLGITTFVQFTGSLFGDEKIRTLRECHVFAHPSRTDGLPPTIMEAASLGLPCLISEATNMRPFIDQYDAGYTMQHLDKTECCKELTVLYDRIVNKKEAGMLQSNAFAMIDTAFDWTIILHRFEALYRKALRQPAENLRSPARLAPLTPSPDPYISIK